MDRRWKYSKALEKEGGCPGCPAPDIRPGQVDFFHVYGGCQLSLNKLYWGNEKSGMHRQGGCARVGRRTSGHPPHPLRCRWHPTSTERGSAGALDTALSAGGMPPAGTGPAHRLNHASLPLGTPADGPAQRSNGAWPPPPRLRLFPARRSARPGQTQPSGASAPLMGTHSHNIVQPQPEMGGIWTRRYTTAPWTSTGADLWRLSTHNLYYDATACCI